MGEGGDVRGGGGGGRGLWKEQVGEEGFSHRKLKE